jgi:cell division protein FtsB
MASSGRRAAGSGRRAVLRRLLWVAGGAGALWFAVEGGEFGTWDLIRQRRDIARNKHAIDSVRTAIASLKAFKDSVETNPAVQERIAREQFGMVRDKELMYRFVDSAAVKK